MAQEIRRVARRGMAPGEAASIKKRQRRLKSTSSLRSAGKLFLTLIVKRFVCLTIVCILLMLLNNVNSGVCKRRGRALGETAS